VKRPSALETLKTLRQRQHDTEQSRLASSLEREQAAADGELRAREALLGNLEEARATRRHEDTRLERDGISAADGQRRALWEASARRAAQQLSANLTRAAEIHRKAQREHEQLRLAVQQSHAALEQVEQRLQRDARLLDRKLEHSQQESLDEAASRRFTERGEP
jgi:hypothetical protein